MKKYYKMFIILSIGFLFSIESKSSIDKIIKKYKPSNGIESLINDDSTGPFHLIQLELKNDSLVSIINSILPNIAINSPASYHRVVNNEQFNIIQQGISDQDYFLIRENYILPINSRRPV